MSTPAQPAAPAPTPTPRTDACLHEYEHQNDLTCFDDMPYPTELLKLARQLERELTAAKQPVPDAGVRDKVRKILGTPDDLAEHLHELGWRSSCDAQWDNLRAWHSSLSDRILALLPAPTPATSEDTLMLDWLEKNGETLINGGTRYGSYVYPDYFKENKRVGYFVKDTLRQALRAAMAHAGAQKT